MENKLKIEYIPIKDLKPSKYNPRKMLNEDLEKLKNSIKKFGFLEPIIINKNLQIIGGHQRIKAAESLGMEKVPCIIVNLDEKKEKILNLALNRIVGTWDEEKLIKLIGEINDYPDIYLTGFDKQELDLLTVEYQIEYENKEKTKFDDEDLKKIFEVHEAVEIPVERPSIKKINEDKIAFYCTTMEEWNLIKENFKTNRKGELDIKKLLSLIK